MKIKTPAEIARYRLLLQTNMTEIEKFLMHEYVPTKTLPERMWRPEFDDPVFWNLFEDAMNDCGWRIEKRKKPQYALDDEGFDDYSVLSIEPLK